MKLGSPAWLAKRRRPQHILKAEVNAAMNELVDRADRVYAKWDKYGAFALHVEPSDADLGWPWTKP